MLILPLGPQGSQPYALGDGGRGGVLDLSAANCFPVSPEFQVLSPSPVSLLKTHHFLSFSATSAGTLAQFCGIKMVSNFRLTF